MSEDNSLPVEFRVLGEVEARIGGVPADLGHARQRSVLAVLLVELNNPVPVDQLVDRVWGERAPNSARESLYSYLSRLRQALTGVTIVRRSGGYVLSVNPDAVDLHRFRGLVAQAREKSDTGLFEAALGLWRGEPFAGLTSPWLVSQRADLEQKRLAAELDRNDLELSQGIGRVPELSARAAQFPLDERLAGQLMQALHRSGRQSRALAVYDETRRALADQLGIDPSPELTELRQQILTNNVTTARRFELPRDVRQFTGRTSELRDLLRSVEQSGSVAAIDGMAGIGKTALVVRLAHQLAPRYPDGQLFLDLHAYTPGSRPLTPGAALDKLLRAVGVAGAAIPDDTEERAALWRAKLAGRRMLVVLDNASETAQIRPLLPGTAECLVLITSRQRLTGLDGAFVRSLDVLSAGEARELFARVVGETRASAEPVAVSDVLRLCGYLPLAIRLAAARLQHRPTWTVAHLAGRLRDQRQLTELQSDDHSVATAFGLSYQQLDAGQKRMFRLLGRVPGADFDVYPAAALGDLSLAETDRLLESLLDAHLLLQPRAGRYRLHDLLHAYASQLDDPDEHAAHQRLLAFYLHAASVAMDVIAPHERHRRVEVVPSSTPVPEFTSYDTALAWLETERPNLLAAAVAADREYTSQLSASLWRFLYLRGHHDDAMTLHTNALQAAQAAGDRVLEGRAIYNLGMTFERLGRYEDAIDHIKRAIAVFQETGMRLLEGHALNSLGMALSWRAETDQAMHYYELAATVGRETASGALEGMALDNIGIELADQGRHEDAITHFKHALAIYEAIDSMYLQGSALENLGSIFTRLGEYERAIEHLESALDIALSARYRDQEAEVRNSMGIAARRAGDAASALAHHREALAIGQETGLLICQARAHDGLGWAYRDLGDMRTCREHWEQAILLYTELGVPGAEAIRLVLETS